MFNSIPNAIPLSKSGLGRWCRGWAHTWEEPVGSALLALEFYALLAIGHSLLWYGSVAHLSEYPFFNYLADAFLHGQLYLRLIPPDTHDLVFWHGQYFLYWPPLPAFLLMPFIAVFGIQFSDVFFSVGIAACNVLLVAVLLREACRQSIIRLSRVRRGLLVSCFAFGTAHITLAPLGRVWFTSQLVCLLLILLAYVACMRLRGGMAWLALGMSLAGAMLTRNHTVLAGVWPVAYLLSRQGWDERGRLVRNIFLLAVPLMVALLFIGAYDWLRFGNPFDNGYADHNMDPRYVADVEQYGLFNLHYLPANLYYQYVAYPFPLNDASSLEGGSLFWLTPVFLAAFWGARRLPRWSVALLLATITSINIPILLLLGTGWMQFGPRYSLDFVVPLLLLTAAGLRSWPVRLLALLTVISVVQYVIGAVYLARILG